MKKILILVMSSGSLKNRRQGILDSWGTLVKNYDNIDLIFYSDDEEPSTNTYLLDCPFTFTYYDNEIKTLTSFKLVKEIFYNKYDWYLWVDDDTFVNVSLLNEKIDEFPEECLIGRDITGCWGDLKYLSGGAGFMCSDKFVHNLFDLKNFKTGYNDVSIGKNFKEKQLKMKSYKYFDPQNPFQNKNLHQAREQFKNRITYHRLNPKQMEELMQYLYE